MAIYQSQYTGKQIDEAVAKQKIMAEQIDEAVAKQEVMAEQIEKNHQIAIRNSKQIENLKQGTAVQFETDTAVAYVKNVPDNALPYAEIKKIGGMTYKDGNTLKSAKVTEVESVGENLFSTPIKGTFINPENGESSVSSTAAATDFIRVDMHSHAEYFISGLSGDLWNFVTFYDANKNFLGRTGAGQYTARHLPSEIENNGVAVESVSYIRVAIYENSGAGSQGTISSIDNLPLMMNKGSSALPYRPYVKHTLPIPEAVRNKSWYGLGVPNSDVYNSIVWNENGSVDGDIKCGAVDLRDLYWESTENNAWYNRALVGIAKLNVGLCDTYTFIPETAIEDSADKTIQIRADIMFIKDASITDASQITGTLIYGLAAPTTEDISDLITSDNIIGVQGRGTMTFESEHKYAVPSEVEYQVEV